MREEVTNDRPKRGGNDRFCDANKNRQPREKLSDATRGRKRRSQNNSCRKKRPFVSREFASFLPFPPDYMRQFGSVCCGETHRVSLPPAPRGPPASTNIKCLALRRLRLARTAGLPIHVIGESSTCQPYFSFYCPAAVSSSVHAPRPPSRDGRATEFPASRFCTMAGIEEEEKEEGQPTEPIA